MTLVVARWRPADGVEPLVRIGIVLPADSMERLTLHVPDVAYDLSGGEGGKSVRSTTVVIEARGDGVAASVDSKSAGTGNVWRISPRDSDVSTKAASIRIDDIVAGRGFHWQARTQQWLPGALTVRCIGGQLLLMAEMPVEQYLVGVITSEMSGECPPEFMKAQAVVARSWTLAAAERKHADLDLDLCNDDCCQRYQGVAGITYGARSAVEATCGTVLTASDGTVVDANYSKSCGGNVEAPEHVWGLPKSGMTALVDAPQGSELQRLIPITSENAGRYVANERGVVDVAYCSPQSVCEADLPRYLGRVDRGANLFRWSVSYERAALEELLRTKGIVGAHAGELADIEVVSRGVSGRATEVNLLFKNTDGQVDAATVRGELTIRMALHESCLYSSAFVVRVDRDADGRALRFHLDGAGWGHGAGLCQIGALGMALAGYDHKKIVAHYFPTARLERVYGP